MTRRSNVHLDDITAPIVQRGHNLSLAGLAKEGYNVDRLCNQRDKLAIAP